MSINRNIQLDNINNNNKQSTTLIDTTITEIIPEGKINPTLQHKTL